MDFTIFVIWILLFFLIPLFLLKTANASMEKQGKISKIIVKLFFSVFVHLSISFATGLFLLLLMGAADPKPGRELRFGLEETLTGLLTVIGYGVSGWLLCSFVNGKLIKSLSGFGFNAEKPQSIFDAE